jgi:hypothetical protein
MQRLAPMWGRSGLFHSAKQRVLMVPRELVYLRYLCFCHFTGEYTANAAASGVHVEHDLGRLFSIHREKHLQDLDDELHRREVIVQ